MALMFRLDPLVPVKVNCDATGYKNILYNCLGVLWKLCDDGHDGQEYSIKFGTWFESFVIYSLHSGTVQINKMSYLSV